MRKLVVSFGGFDPADITKAEELTWPEYVRELIGEVPETTDKSSRGWSIPAKFALPHRNGQNLVERHALTFDYDHIDIFAIEDLRKAYSGFAHLEYTTWSHTEEAPRWRFVFPLSRPCTYDEFQAVSRMVASYAPTGIELTSGESHVVAQFMFLPTKKPDGVYEELLVEGEWIDVDAVLSQYLDWTNKDEWPKRKDGDGVQHAGKSEDPRTKPGVVGAFCRAFTITEAIERFDLPYIATATPDRLTYTKGSRPEGAVIYDDNSKLHSHHDTDPGRGQCNAFDLVRLHLFGSLDKGADPSAPITEKPSFRAMVALASEQEEVMAQNAAEEFADLGDEPVPLPEQETKAAEESDRVQIDFKAGRPVESALDKVLDALRTKGPDIGLVTYGNRLVWAVESGGYKGFKGTEVSTVELRQCTGMSLPAIWHNKICFVRKQKDKEGKFINVKVDCPVPLAQAAVTRADALKDIEVNRITCTPIYTHGELYADRGYSKEFRAWILAPENVRIHGLGRRDAKAALDRVTDWLSEFPFDTEADRDVAVAALLTAAMRASLPHAPGFFVSKPDYGSGASTLCDLINVVLTGKPAAVINASVGRTELEKHLDGALLAGRASLVIDNVTDGETFNSIALAQILSQPTKDIRALGRSDVASTPCTQMVLVNGNNIRIGDDLVRRFLRIHLDPRCESPHRRSFKRPDLIRQAQDERSDILSDLYTIIAAYEASPDRMPVPPLAGFEAWVRSVVEPLIWLGRSNPAESQKLIEREDDKRTTLRGIMGTWAKLFSDNPVTTRDIFEGELEDQHVNDDKRELRELFAALNSDPRGGTGISAKSVGRWLRSIAGKVMSGMYFEESGTDKTNMKRWRLHGAAALEDWLQ